jgi:PAS domain S-box-containing protein
LALRDRPYWQRLLLAALVYTATMLLDGVITRGAVPSPSWFDAGAALAAMLLLGWDVLPVFPVLNFVSAIIAGWPLPLALASAVVVTLEALLGAWLLEKAQFRITFQRVRDAWLFLTLGVIVSTLPAMITGVAALAIGWGAPYGAVLSVLGWWMGDVIGVLTVTPFLLVMFAGRMRPPKASPLETVERVALALTAFTVSVLPLTPVGTQVSWIMPYAVIPLLVWCAVRFEVIGAASAVFGLALIAVLETMAGFGPYAAESATTGFIQLQVFLVVVGSTALTLGAAVAETRQEARERESAQARYRALVENVPAVTYEAGAEAPSALEYVSPRIVDVLGYTPEEWYATAGDWLDTIIHPDDREALRAAMDASDETGTLAVEYRILDKRGVYHWVSDRAVRTTNEAGEDVYTGSFSDETEMRDAERALRDAEEHLRLVVENTKDVIMRIGPGFQVLYASPSVREVMGATPGEVAREAAADSANGRRAEHFAPLRRAVDGVLAGGEPVELEIAFPAEGGPSYFNALLTPERDETGAARSVVVVARDINERKAKDEALRESEARFRAMIQNTTDVIVRFDSEGRFSYVNPAAASTMGRESGDFIGKTPADIGMPAEIADRWNAGIVKVLETGGSLESDYLLPLPDGPRYFSSITTPDTDADGSRTVTVISRDMTARRETELAMVQQREALEALVVERTAELQTANERLMELDRLKSMFIASMSHELRTPLNSVIGFSGVLLSGIPGTVNDEQRSQLEMVSAAGQHLLAIVNDILDVSQIEAGGVEPSIGEFALEGVQQEAIELMRHEADAKGLALEWEPCEIVMRSDRRRVLQCLVNLTSNAVKYTDRGSVRMWSRRTNGAVEIAVTDTGSGIPDRERPMVFAPFSRLDYETHASKPGTGLGLYLTKKVATDVLGGDVDFTSQPGTGSTFTLTLPAQLSGSPSAGDGPG